MKISYGATASYLQLAQDIGNEKSVRAVASANGANAIALIIPCHRIIGSDGQLVGYGGGLSVKQRLLKLEQNHNQQAFLADSGSSNNTQPTQTSFLFPDD